MKHLPALMSLPGVICCSRCDSARAAVNGFSVRVILESELFTPGAGVAVVLVVGRFAVGSGKRLRKRLDRMGSIRSPRESDQARQGNQGGKIRAALTARTALGTIPQIFVGGEFLGGCTDVFDACKQGRLQALLEKNDVPYDHDIKQDPYSFLPSWLQTKEADPIGEALRADRQNRYVTSAP